MSEEQPNRDVKIGELLTGVGVVTSGDLQEAIQIAKRMNLPIGRVIVMSGVITEQNLQYALEAQSLIRDGLLDLDTALAALKGCYKKGQSLQEALAEHKWAPKQDRASNKLGELLLDSNMVSQSQLDQALHASFETGMPLGGTLVLQGVLSAQLLPMVLTAQEQIRDGKITRMDAVEQLKSAVLFWAKADEVANKSTYYDIAAESVSSRAVATSSGYVAPSSPPPAPKRVPTREIPAPPAAPRKSYVPPVGGGASGIDLSLVDMMKFSGFCTEDDIQSSLEQALTNSEIASRLFMATGLLNQAALDNFLRCRSLIRKGLISQEQALEALSLWQGDGISLDEAFHDLGLNVPGTASSGW